MATENVKDYLGHRSELAEAFERFAEPVSNARKLARNEPREIARQLGIALNRISDHIGLAHDATGGICERVESVASTDDPAVALLQMLSEHQLKTSNEFFQFAGVVLVALEQANLVRDEEVTHG